MKRDGVIAVLTTFCLTATLVMVSSSVGYDPWADTNDDGKIDMKDIGYTARMFGASDDPTKNVTVVSRTSELIIVVDGTLVGADDIWYSGFFRVDGYSKMTILVATSYTQNAYSLVTKGDNVATLFTVDYAQNIGPSLVRTYDVTNHEVEVRYHNAHTTFITLGVQIYLIA